MDAMPQSGDWMLRHCNLHSAMVRVSLLHQVDLKQRLTALTEHVCCHPEFSQRFLDLLQDLEAELTCCECATGLRESCHLEADFIDADGQPMVILENVLGIN